VNRVQMCNNSISIVSDSQDKVKEDFNKKDIYIEGNHDFSLLKDLEGIEAFENTKKGVKIRITDERYAEEIYNQAIKLGYLKRFQVAEPSLNDIFIAKVGDQHE